MYNASDLKKGLKIEIDGDPCMITQFEFSKPGKGQALEIDAERIEQWQEASGFSAADYNYYLIFAGMRYGLILSRVMLATGQDGEVQDNFACRLLGKHLERIA